MASRSRLERSSSSDDRLTEAVRLLGQKLRHRAEKDTSEPRRRRQEQAAHLVEAAVQALTGEAADTPDDLPDVEQAIGGLLRALGGTANPDDSLEGLRGTSRAITVPELLGFVSTSYKSGLLRVQTSDESYLIQVDQGFIAYAQSDSPPEEQLFGNVVVERGILEREEVERFVRSKQNKRLFLGQALLEEGLITREEHEAVLAYQVLRLFMRLCAAQEASFWFYEGASVRAVPDIRLNVTHLLLETARLKDEAVMRAAIAAPLPEEKPSAAAPADHGEDVEPIERFRSALRGRIESGRLELPLLPDTAGRLLAMCWDDKVDAESLKDHIGHDQALCAHVLRIANSSAYAPTTQIVSLQLALARLGMNRLREIALAVTVRQRAFSVPGWQDEIQRMWKGALITCEYAKEIARRTGQGKMRSSLYGLLQDVGKPVVLNALAGLRDELKLPLDPDDALALVQEFHAEVGAYLARDWSMPDWLEPVIRHHHEVGLAEEHRIDAVIASLAEHLAQHALAPQADGEDDLAQLEAWAELELDEDDVRELLEDTPRIVALAESVF